MSAPLAIPEATRWLSYPALVDRARWTVSAGSVGLSVKPEVGSTRLFFALDRFHTYPNNRRGWKPVRAGSSFDRATRYRLRRGVDVVELGEFLRTRELSR